MSKTYSVRRGSLILGEEFWLASKTRPVWMYFENRKRFDSQQEADDKVKELFGPEFQNYGVFPNS
jgi:hypothetical protein